MYDALIALEAIKKHPYSVYKYKENENQDDQGFIKHIKTWNSLQDLKPETMETFEKWLVNSLPDIDKKMEEIS